MKFIVTREIFERFPEFKAGVVIAKGIKHIGLPEEIKKKFREAEEELKRKFEELEAPSQHPNIRAWREAYRAFGADPGRYNPSNEALVRQVLKGRDLWGIHPIVDLYNYISIKYVLPVGGEDLDTLEGGLTLDFAEGEEEFIKLGGEENDPPESGEVIYKDDRGVVCRRWNWREGERTKITKDTENAIIVIDTLPPTSEVELQKAIDELADLVSAHCGAKTETRLIGKNNPEMET
ncbi:MAG: B3/4 domain-containing protein [Nanoarchaeota archaeon]|nr:B3/4 domain-containing protein [Nanoarchaeota archaeon]